MENKVYFVELTEEQKKFLEKYKPEEDMFTSKEEMETITSLFCLKERDRKDLIGLVVICLKISIFASAITTRFFQRYF